jgi:DNA-binding transcriptional ArsR family regulator
MRTVRHKPQPQPQIVEILFGAYRRQILGLLLLRADETFYVREIARVTGVPAGSIHRELKALSDASLLTRTSSGNQVRYQANRECPIYEELAGIFRKTAGLADVLRELLQPLGKKIEFALVFGSVAAGQSWKRHRPFRYRHRIVRRGRRGLSRRKRATGARSESGCDDPSRLRTESSQGRSIREPDIEGIENLRDGRCQ